MPTSGTSPEDQIRFKVLWEKNGRDRPGCYKLDWQAECFLSRDLNVGKLLKDRIPAPAFRP